MQKKAMKNKSYHIIVRHYFKTKNRECVHALTIPRKNNSAQFQYVL